MNVSLYILYKQIGFVLKNRIFKDSPFEHMSIK